MRPPGCASRPRRPKNDVLFRGAGGSNRPPTAVPRRGHGPSLVSSVALGCSLTFVRSSGIFSNTLFLDRTQRHTFREMMFKSNQIIFFLFDYQENGFSLRRAVRTQVDSRPTISSNAQYQTRRDNHCVRPSCRNRKCLSANSNIERSGLLVIGLLVHGSW